jgi:hypothetical protein
MPLAEVSRCSSHDMMDPETLRAAATLARLRAESAQRHPRVEGDERDGLERLGAYRALTQLANDLEVTARHAEDGEPPDDDDHE